MPEHDCPHPVGDTDNRGLTVWTCPDCGRVWEAHTDIWWGPAEDNKGQPIYLRGETAPAAGDTDD